MAPRGTRRRLSPARRFVGEIVRAARKVPSMPVARTMSVAAITPLRHALAARPSWTALLIKAYGLLCRERPPLRRAFVQWPTAHLYEHPCSVAAVSVEREWGGEPVVLGTRVTSPEDRAIPDIHAHLYRYKHAPILALEDFRASLFLGRLRQPLRGLVRWAALDVSGAQRARRLGTFLVSSYGSLGAEQLHPRSPLTTVLTFGPISANGTTVVKLVYDHRVLDGAYVARCLARLEEILQEDIRAELARLRASSDPALRQPSARSRADRA